MVADLGATLEPPAAVAGPGAAAGRALLAPPTVSACFNKTAARQLLRFVGVADAALPSIFSRFAALQPPGCRHERDAEREATGGGGGGSGAGGGGGEARAAARRARRDAAQKHPS